MQAIVAKIAIVTTFLPFLPTTATKAHISLQRDNLNSSQLDILQWQPLDVDPLARRLRMDNRQSSAEFLAQALLLTPPKVNNQFHDLFSEFFYLAS